jgi:hypothetical protein
VTPLAEQDKLSSTAGSLAPESHTYDSGVCLMTILDIRVPQMGQGLREELIHKLLKRPGEFGRRDEVI